MTVGATDLVPAGLTAVATFAATNIDDIVLLMLWFSQTGQSLRGRHIVAGQYLGFIALVAVSLLGFLGGLLIPPAWIGLLGLVPILLGLRQLWELRASDGDDGEGAELARLAARGITSSEVRAEAEFTLFLALQTHKW